MGICSPRSVDSPVLDIVPLLCRRGLDVLADLRPGLRNVDEDRQQPPLPHETNVELLGDERDENADSVARRQKVAGEEVIGVCAGLDRPHKQGGSGLLRITELLRWISDRPSVPVLQDEVLVILQEPGDPPHIGSLEQAVEPLVLCDLVKDLEWGRGRVRRFSSVGDLVEILVQVVVTHRGHPQGLHGNLLALEFVGIPKMDQGVAN